MKPFMTLTVTTDKKLTPNSKTVELTLPVVGSFTDKLFDIGLVTEVDGYRNLKVLVVKQEGFEGRQLVGERLELPDLTDWNELAKKLFCCEEHKIFAYEAYMRFMGSMAHQINDGEDYLDDIIIIPKNDEPQMRKFLTNALEEYYQIYTRGEDVFFNWDIILNDYISNGWGMLYKDNYIMLNAFQIGEVSPLPERLKVSISVALARSFPMDDGRKELLKSLQNYKLKDLLRQLTNGTPLPPAFLDNELREKAFKELGERMSIYDLDALAEGYERIWVKPVKGE